MAKVNKERKKELIKVKLSSILLKSSSNPKFEGVTIIDIKLSPDSASAVVYYSVFDSRTDTSGITEALNKASGFFQARLAKTLKSRNTPKLRFVFDGGFDHSASIDKLLMEVNKDLSPESE